MQAGDGLLVRVRPRLGRLMPEQAIALAAAALAHGSGLLDVTRRANIQIRGVREAQWPRLLDTLVEAGLVDADPACEARRSILVSPTWLPGDDTHRIAVDLAQSLAALPALPGKAGFVIDAGIAPILSAEPGDFRIERSAEGPLMLRADGRPLGKRLQAGQEAAALVDMAHWFMATGGERTGRMARHDRPLPERFAGDAAPAQAMPLPEPGRHGTGVAYGLPFGRLSAQAMLRLAQAPGITAFRTTPWRILVAEGGRPVAVEGLSILPDDPLRHVDACPGKSGCLQASVETRPLARRLARHVRGRLHVSGCDKGCANPAATDVVVTGRGGRYDLAFGRRPGSAPDRPGLRAEDIIAHFGAD